MSKKLNYLLYALLLLNLGLIFLSSQIPLTLNNGATLKKVPCWFPKPSSYRVHCAYYTPPIEKQNQKHRFRLPVVYIQVNPKKRDPHPIIYISGGPGVSVGIDEPGIFVWFEWLYQMKWQRDILLFDQRGVGLALPKAQCRKIRNEKLRNLRRIKTTLEARKDNYNSAQSCFNLLKNEFEIDLISTQRTVDDVINLMRLNKAKSWNVYAFSYGTRVALELLKRKPKELRAVILDSVYPQNKNELLVGPTLIENGLKKLYTECRLSYFCNIEAPLLAKKVNTITTRLNKKPFTISLKIASQKNKITVLIDGDRFKQALFQGLYSWRSIRHMPAIINKVHAGKVHALKPLLRELADAILNPSFSRPVNYSVECGDRPTMTTKKATLAKLDTQSKKYAQLNSLKESLWKYDLCKAWKTKHVRNEFFKLPQASTPTLILNGELDPVTPWHWANEVHKSLPKSYLFLVKGIGHNAIDSDDCSSKLAKLFLQNPNKKPRDKCQRVWHRPEFKF